MTVQKITMYNHIYLFTHINNDDDLSRIMLGKWNRFRVNFKELNQYIR